MSELTIKASHKKDKLCFRIHIYCFNYILDNLKEKTDKNNSKSTLPNKQNNLSDFENALDNIVKRYFN